MSRYIEADGFIADMRERYCKPCQERKEDYNGVRCRVCWVDDAMDDADGFGDNGIDLVRCKSCKHWSYGKDLCNLHDMGMLADDFCSYGEVRDE